MVMGGVCDAVFPVPEEDEEDDEEDCCPPAITANDLALLNLPDAFITETLYVPGTSLKTARLPCAHASREHPDDPDAGGGYMSLGTLKSKRFPELYEGTLEIGTPDTLLKNILLPVVENPLPAIAISAPTLPLTGAMLVMEGAISAD